jgi:hypothetical protein
VSFSIVVHPVILSKPFCFFPLRSSDEAEQQKRRDDDEWDAEDGE